MKKGWETKDLAAVSAINYGYTESASSEPVGPRFLRITDIQDDQVDWDNVPYCKIEKADLPKYRLASGDIVFARTGATTGKSFLVNEPPEAVFASYLIRLRLLDKKLLPEFVLLFFQTAGYWQSIKDGSSGSAQGGFNATKLGALTIPVPPLAEQQRIVGLLDEAFEGLVTAKANAEKNLQNARALFESHLQSVFTQRGPGWVEKPLGEVADLLDCLHKTPTYAETGFPMVRVTDIKPGLLDLSKTRKVDEQTFIAFSKGRNPRAGDIVFSRVGSCGVSALVGSDEPFCLGQNTVFILPKMNSMLLYHFLNSPNAKEQFEGFIDGTTQPTISMKSIRQVAVPIAPPAEHTWLVTNLDSMREETQRLARLYERKLAALAELKKSLLHQAFTGEL